MQNRIPRFLYAVKKGGEAKQNWPGEYRDVMMVLLILYRLLKSPFLFLAVGPLVFRYADPVIHWRRRKKQHCLFEAGAGVCCLLSVSISVAQGLRFEV